MRYKPIVNDKEILNDELIKLIIEFSPTAFLLTNSAGIIILINKQFESIFGYKKKEVIGKKVEILIPGHSKSRHTEYRDNYMSAPSARMMGKGRDLTAIKKNGLTIPVEIGLSPLSLNSETYVLASIVDISERKNSELEVKQARDKLSAIMENSTDAIIEFDEEGNILTINNEAKIQYFTNSNPNNNHRLNVWDIIPTETVDNYRTLLDEVKNGRKVHDLETKRVMYDGTKKTVSIGLTYIEDEIGRFIETARDINERIILRNKIVEIEKSQIIGKMSEGIAHHLGTPLASMLLRVQMLKDDFADSNDMDLYIDKLDQIEKQIGYGQNILSRILKFVGRPTYDKQQTNLSSLVVESIEIVRPLLNKSNVKLVTTIPESCVIECEQNLLQMVISDLIMNSVDAISSNGKIIINAHTDVDNNIVTIKIQDNGSGIPKNVLPFIFEPFYTTKSPDRGTGLGLAVAKNVIQEHNGDISIESKLGKGTEVIIKLPQRKGASIN